MKRNVTKVLSILCLVAVLACGFLPSITLTGSYMELLNGITGASAAMPEESYTAMEQMLETQGITIDLKASMDSLTTLAVPLSDGEISIMDFYKLSENAKEVANQLGGLPLEGLGISADETDPVKQALLPISNMVSSLAQVGQTMGMVSSIFLIPVVLFGLLALAVVVRIILRLFNRRGLGVFITLLSILNAALIVGISYGVTYAASEGLPIGAEFTYVPYVLVGCSIASCIIWGIGRGAKVKKVKEVPVEVPVAQPTPVVEEPEVKEPMVEEAAIAEEVMEEILEEESGEEETPVEEEVLIDTELVEEVVEEEQTEE